MSVSDSTIVEYVSPTDEGIQYIADNMRQDDIDEVWRCNQMTPHDALSESIKASEESYMIIINGEPVGVFGVVSPGMMNIAGVPWMLGTEGVVQHVTVFIRRTSEVIDRMLVKYGQLYNYVDTKNKKSIRMLRLIGFKIEDPEPYGMMGHSFHKFTKGY